METLFDAFQKYIETKHHLSPVTAGEYKVVAIKFAEYLNIDKSTRHWYSIRLLIDKDLAKKFLDKEYGNKKHETYEQKKKAIEAFQEYVLTEGRLGYVAAFAQTIEKHPTWYLLGLIISVMLCGITLADYFELKPSNIVNGFIQFFANPYVPKPINPLEGEVLENGCFSRESPISWTFSWEEVEGASEYHVLVYSLGAGIPLIDSIVSSTSITHTENAVITLNNTQDWRWRVRAYVNNEWQPWSRYIDFEVEVPKRDC